MNLLLVVGVSGVVFGGACAIVASNKDRDAVGWFALGFVFNLVALIVIAALKPFDKLKEGDRQPFPASRDIIPSLEKEELRRKAADLATALAQSKMTLEK